LLIYKKRGFSPRFFITFCLLFFHMNYEIRIVQPDDVKALRALRLEALQRDPDAFLATVAAELANTDDVVKTRITPDENGFIIAAFHGVTMVGMVGARREQWEKVRHTMDVWGTYVTANARGQGVCAAMMRALEAQARTCAGVQCLKLGVIEGNAALRTYESVGYVKFATEPLFMRKLDGVIAAQHMMMRAL
jgi:ribosomal protein S18 acetylase RimI-like enzyme